MLKEGLGDAEYVLLDLDRTRSERVAAMARRLAERRRLGCVVRPMVNADRALEGADSVIITISTGGLHAMARDLAIPEKYGIFQTVGDTVGPGGWARSLRNIPVFVRLARKVRRRAPGAFVLNYTNPMGTLTSTLCRLLDQPVVGLCHGVFEVYRVLMQVFGLKSEDDLSMNFGGLNHFFWVLDFAVRGRDGYALLRRRIKGRRLFELVAEAYVDPAGFHSRYRLASELFEQVGYLPYFGDRHTCEFLSGYINGEEARLEAFRLIRTTAQERQRKMDLRRRRLEAMIAGREPLPGDQPSRETAADITTVKALGGHLIDVVNLPNRGQIANLPAGAVVETLGVVTPMGFTPLAVGPLPRPVHGLVYPHAVNQQMIVEAMFEGDREKAMQALLNDPLCSHLARSTARRMGEELLRAHAAMLPRPFGTAPALRL